MRFEWEKKMLHHFLRSLVFSLISSSWKSMSIAVAVVSSENRATEPERYSPPFVLPPYCCGIFDGEIFSESHFWVEKQTISVINSKAEIQWNNADERDVELAAMNGEGCFSFSIIPLCVSILYLITSYHFLLANETIVSCYFLVVVIFFPVYILLTLSLSVFHCSTYVSFLFLIHSHRLVAIVRRILTHFWRIVVLFV